MTPKSTEQVATPHPTHVSKKQETVAVDLDGTLAYYTSWQGEWHIGQPNPGAKEFVDLLKTLGYRVILHTTRRDNDVLRSWLHDNQINVDDVWSMDTSQAAGRSKPIACAYVDDRAVSIPKNPDSSDFTEAAIHVYRLANRHG